MSPNPTVNQSIKIKSHERAGENVILKFTSLNVAGLVDKMNKGILDQFLSEEDIIYIYAKVTLIRQICQTHC